MKILIVITKSELGGAQVFALNLARGLKANGEDVTVAGGPGEYLPAELEKSGIPFHLLKKLERSRNPLKALGFMAELKAYAAAEKFEIVHLNSTNALLGVWGLDSLKPKPRVVFTVHGLSLLDSGHAAMKTMKAAYRWFFKAAFRNLDALVFVSRLNQEFALKTGLLAGGLEHKSYLVYNGVDFAPEYLLGREEARSAMADSLKLTSEDWIAFQSAYLYGSIGRLAYPKNYEFLINAHKAVKAVRPNAKLILIGEGPERAKYEGLIRSYKLENDVILAGELHDASRYLRAFNLFVLPSVFEGLSLSLIEAVQAGVPVLASRVGGNEEVVGEKRCFKLNGQAEFLKLMEKAEIVPESAADFSAEKMVKEYLRVYRG